MWTVMINGIPNSVPCWGNPRKGPRVALGHALVLLTSVLLIGCADTFAAEIRIILRMDDSGFGRHMSALEGAVLTDAEITRRVIEITARHGAKLTIAVIPNVVSGSPGYNPHDPKYLLLSLRNDELSVLQNATKSKCVEIALHGWTHQEVTRYGGRPSEFGGRPFEEQSARLVQGREELERSLGIPIEVLVPPFNNHDQTTLLALQELNFKAISSGARDDDAVKGLRYVPCTTSLKQVRSAVAEAAHAGQASFIVAMFHGYEFAETGCKTGWLSLEDFDDLLRELSANRDVRFTTILTEALCSERVFDAEGSRLYATYCDRVGRIADMLSMLGPLGTRLQAILPAGRVLYLESRMRRIAFLMLCVEIAVNALLGVAVACLFIVGLRVLSRFPWARYVLALFLAGGFICLVFLLTEGIVGIVGKAGFGSRLILMITCAGAGLTAGLIQASKRNRKSEIRPQRAHVVIS